MAKPKSKIAFLPGSSMQQGGFAVAVGSAFWGLFWIPLRFLNDNGFPGLWAVALVMLIGLIAATFPMLRGPQWQELLNKSTWVIGGALSISAVTYFTGMMFSDVIRVIFLFYLLPVWTTLTARIVYKEKISPSSIVVIVLALAGLWLLLGGGDSLPVPNNFGDWCGLMAGMFWGISLAVIRGAENVSSRAAVFSSCLLSTLLAFSVALIVSQFATAELAVAPNPSSVLAVLGAASLFAIVFLYPSMISQIWGAQRVPAPTAALLTMSEILVATISAYLLIGTELNRVSIMGAAIILCAVLIDIRIKFRADV